MEYNTWLLFRQVVDIILLNDFLSYVLFAFCNLDFVFPSPPSYIDAHPESKHGFGMLFLRLVGGAALLLFNLWVKTSAHDVVKDYGWYWGDCFFSRGHLRQPITSVETPTTENKELHFDLVFDGIFEMAPHPMYSVGYAGYYGVSLLTASYPVLFVSLAAHAAQFAFLNFFENPHIERRYGVRKLLAERTPIPSAHSRMSSAPTRVNSTVTIAGSAQGDGEERLNMVMKGSRSRSVSMGTTSEETTVIDSEEGAVDVVGALEMDMGLFDPEMMPLGGNSDPVIMPPGTPPSEAKEMAREAVTQHDLLNKFFRGDVIVLSGLDLLR